MEVLERLATPNTPYVNFDAVHGQMIISGRTIPNPADEFWAPLLKWFYAYSTAPKRITKFIFDMEYFNNASSKKILFLLHKMNDLLENGFDISVEWRYSEDDPEMKEAGHDFSCVVNVPFHFQAVKKEETVI